MTDSIALFWGAYILKITEQSVPEGARRWCIRHVETFIHSRSGGRLAATTQEDVDIYRRDRQKREISCLAAQAGC